MIGLNLIRLNGSISLSIKEDSISYVPSFSKVIFLGTILPYNKGLVNIVL